MSSCVNMIKVMILQRKSAHYQHYCVYDEKKYGNGKKKNVRQENEEEYE